MIINMIKNIGKITYPPNNTLIFGETHTVWNIGEKEDISVNQITDENLPEVSHVFIAEHYSGSCVGETMVWEHEFPGSFALALARLLTFDYEMSFEDWEPPKYK